MNSLEKTLIEEVTQSGDLDFQGFRLQAFQGGKKIVNLSMGEVFDFYDIASITKIVFTTSVLMRAVEAKAVSLKTPVQKILPWYRHSKILLSQLLNHSAGNEWWQPFYKKVDLKNPVEQKFLQIQNMIRDVPLGSSKKAVYSDIDFYLLGAVIEKIYSKPLYQVWEDYKEEVFPKSGLHFNYQNKSKKPVSKYAPTEKCYWRKKVVRGQVHDENAWAMGGVAPHAGLFGRIQDLSDWGLKIRDIFKEDKGFVKKSTLQKFCKRSLPEERGDWGFGFMIPSKTGSSAGELYSKKSFGHTGFTGTSLWFDPQRDLLVSLLSNRVFPSRKNKGFQRLRPKIHDWIVRDLEGKV